MTTITKVESVEEFAQQAAEVPASTLLVVFFHASWAPPCKQMSKVLETLASTYPVESPPRIKFLSIDAEELPEIPESYDVTEVPHIVLRRGETIIQMQSGNDVSKVREAIEKHVGMNENKSKMDLPPAQQVTKPAQDVEVDPKRAAVENAAANGISQSSESGEPEVAARGQEDANKTEFFAKMKTLVNSAPIMLFMKGIPSAPQCGFSRQLVSLLREKRLRYGFFNILADDEVRQGLKEYADWPTFPQLWVDGELVGGLDIVKEEFEANADFLKEHAVTTYQHASKGPAAPDAHAQTA